MPELKLSAEQVAGLHDRIKNWRLVGQGEACRYWEADVEGVGTIVRTEYLESEELFRMNAELRKESSGRRYTDGAGSDKNGNLPMVRTGQIPENVYYQEIAPRLKQGERGFINWFLGKHPEYRTNEGALRKRG